MEFEPKCMHTSKVLDYNRKQNQVNPVIDSIKYDNT